jgi:chromosome segregation ATPase
MDVDARFSEDHYRPVMIQEQALTDAALTTPSDPWSDLAHLAELPAQVEPEPEPVPAQLSDLTAAVAQLATELADERRRRAVADEGRRRAEERVHVAELDATCVGADLAAARARIGELERDRDEVIRRAEELLTAVRERADQRLASELDSARGHWSELLDEERRRIEVLERERATLATRVEDAWLATAVLRRARPLRLPAPAETAEEAQEEVLEALDEYEIDPDFAAQSPELTDEIELLRQRLRTRVHKPADIDTVEDGVDRLREARLARDAAGKSRHRR